MDQTKNDSGQSGNKSETPPKVIYTPDKIISALMYIEDVMGRALIPFILGGLLAECLYSDAPVEANGVDLILRPKHLTPEARNTLTTLSLLSPTARDPNSNRPGNTNEPLSPTTSQPAANSVPPAFL